MVDDKGRDPSPGWTAASPSRSHRRLGLLPHSR
ncbi:hypothetical protein MUK42_06809 [Musa troglodytarum]|nr:hypothetical protein MUK42_06809 [Musa troglodytarum]